MIHLLLLVALLAVNPQTQTASIEITLVPAEGEGPDSHGNIGGAVSNVLHPEQYKIVLYAQTNTWYIQPTIKDHFTDIDRRGHWGNRTHLGYRYAAILVQTSFKPTSPTEKLPDVGGPVLARTEVAAKQ
jgi:hypothetical protein